MKKSIFLVAFLIFLGVLFFYFKNSSSPSFYLDFPDKKLLRIDFSGILSFDEEDILGKLSKGKHSYNGTLRGTPSRHPSGREYRFSIDSFALYDKRNWLTIKFDRNESHAYRYSSDPRWSTEEREEIYHTFNIDTTNSNSNLDASLFHQTFRLFITKQGAIREIFLPDKLKIPLELSLRRCAIGPMLSKLISMPEGLPSLFSQKKGKENHWSTKAFILEPLLFEHRIVGRNGSYLKIESRTKERPSEEKDRFYTNEQWMQLHQKKIDENHGLLLWDYDEEARRIRGLDLSYKVAFSSRFMRAEGRFVYTTETLFNFSFEESPFDSNRYVGDNLPY